MKISHKLLLSFLLVASLAGVTTFFTLRSYQVIEKAFEGLMDDPTQMIQALNGLKHAGGQIVSSTSEYAFVHGEVAKLSDETLLEEEEQQLTEEGYEIFEASFKSYEDLTKTVATDENETAENIKIAGVQLIKTGSEIIAMKKLNISGDTVLKKREQFEAEERAYLRIIDDALSRETGEQRDGQRDVHSSIVIATQQTLTVTALTFILAIFSGLYISFLISRPIGKLKDASQKVGAGELDTQIEIDSKDEIGDLARSFNKMVNDLKESRRDLASVKTFSERVTDSMVDFVVVLNMDLTIASVNKATLKLNGYEEHELIGKSINILSGDRPFTQKGLDVLRKNGYQHDLDKLNLNKDGSLTPISMSVSILKDDEGSEIGIVCVGKDVSERKRTEDELRESELKFRSVTQSAVFAIVAADSKGNIVSWNDGAQNIFGYEEAEILGRPLTVLMPKTYHAAHQKGMERHAASGEARVIGKTVELQGLRKDGSEFPLELSLSSWKKGEETFYSGIISDITKRKRAETEREVISEIAQGVTSTANLDELLQLLHRSIERILKAENCFVALYDAKTEMLDMQFWVDKYDAVPPPFKMGNGFTAYVCRNEQAMLMTPKIIEQLLTDEEIELQGTAPAIWLGVPLRTPAGLIGVLTVQHYEDEQAYDLRDLEFLVTVGDQIALAIERKRTESALQVSEEQHRLLFEKSPQPAFIFDLETLAFLAVNDAAVGHYGYSRKELMSTVTARNLRSTDDSPDALERLAQVRSGKEILLDSTRHRKKDGTLIDVEVTMHGVLFAGKNAEIVLVNDVTERKRAEAEANRLSDEMESQRQRLNNTIANVQGVVWETHSYREDENAPRGLNFVSSYVETMLGYSVEEWLSKPGFWLDIVHPEDRDRAEGEAGELYANCTSGTLEFRWLAKDGREVWVESRNQIICDHEGKPVGVRGVTVDITERKRADDALQKSEERYRDLIENAVDVIYTHDLKGNYTSINRAGERILGYTPAEAVKMNIGDTVAPEQVEKARSMIAEKLAGNNVTAYELEAIAKDGHRVPVEVSTRIIYSEGVPVGVQGIARDITERKRTEAALEESEASFKSLFETANDAILVMDEGLFRDCNSSAELLFGTSKQNLIGCSPLVFSPPQQPDGRLSSEKAGEYIGAAIAGEPQFFEWKHLRFDRTPFDAEVSLNRVDFRGAMQIQAIVRDVTERKRVEKARWESEENYRTLFEYAPDGIVIADTESFYLDANASICRMLGYSRDELIGLHASDVVTPPEIEHIGPALSVILSKADYNREWEFRRKDGSAFAGEVLATTMPDGNLMAMIRDITERKRGVQALQESEEKFRQLAANVTDVFYVTSPDLQQMHYVSPAYEQVWGRSVESLYLNPFEWGEAILAQERDAVIAAFTGLATGVPRVEIEFRIARPDGTVRWILSRGFQVLDDEGKLIRITGIASDITQRKQAEKAIEEKEAKFRDLFDNAPIAYHELDIEGRYTRINHTEEVLLGYSNDELKGRRPAEIIVEKVSLEATAAKLAGKMQLEAVERTFIRKDGTQISVLNEDRLIYDELGQVTGIRSTLQDITARKRAEQQLELFNAKLQQSNRELQDFAYVASHDLQEPLRKVQAFSDRLKTKYADKLEGDGLDYLERMRSAANRMQLLIQDLLIFSRVSTKAQPFVSVNLETITKEVLSDLEVRIEETGATVDFADLPTIDADPMQMRQLMQNLVGNALKFREKGKAPSISIRGEQVKSNGNGSASQCQIFVKDNGIGFDEKYTDKIFAVFQRLHGRSEYEGSGVGLAICRKIAERHNGSITAQSLPGDGATFIVTLPLIQARVDTNL